MGEFLSHNMLQLLPEMEWLLRIQEILLKLPTTNIKSAKEDFVRHFVRSPLYGCTAFPFQVSKHPPME